MIFSAFLAMPLVYAMVSLPIMSAGVCKLKGITLWSVSPAELHSIVVLSRASVSSEVINLANEYGVKLVFTRGVTYPYF
jgi:CRISPR/Cas system-associated endonuclease Cas1